MNRTMLSLTIGVLMAVPLYASSSPADLHPIGHEFRPTTQERIGDDPCTDEDGVRVRVYFACDEPYPDGSCADWNEGNLVAEWRSRDGALVAGPVVLGNEFGYAPYSCATSGLVLVEQNGQFRIFDREEPRTDWRPLCEAYACGHYGSDVTATPDGFFIVWSSSENRLQGRFFDSDGAPASEILTIGAEGNSYYGNVVSNSDDQGRALIVWRRSGLTIDAVLVDRSGHVSPSVTVSEFPYGTFDQLGISGGNTGGFVVWWLNVQGQGGWVARRVSVDGPAPTTTTSTTTTTLDASVPVFFPARQLDRVPIEDYPVFQPRLVANGRNRWMASWSSYLDGDRSDDRIHGATFVLSDDDARSWSTIETGKPQTRSSWWTARIATDEAGVWVIPWSEDFRIDLRRSSDNARTWETRTFHDWIEFPWGGGASRTIWGVRLASGSNGHWVAAWASQLTYEERYDADGYPLDVPFECAVRAALSTDRARTWRDARLIAYLPCERSSDLEVTNDEAGNWLIVWNDLGRGIDGSRSADNGGTWSVPKTLIRDSKIESGSIALAASDGTWLLAYSSRHPSVAFTTRILLSRSTDPAEGWSVPVGIAPWHDEDDGLDSSPSVAAGEDGQWGIAWSTHSARGGAGMDADIVAAFSNDDGESWSDARIVDPHAVGDTRTDVFPQLARSEESWAVLWHSFERPGLNSPFGDGSIRFARDLGGCGDGRLDGDEECDDGNFDSGDGCDSTCLLTGCGSGVVTGGEECDDGNLDDDDSCLTTCRLAFCGDGVVRAVFEQCDDGNDLESDACHGDCTPATCGDGIVHIGVEECDEGLENAYDGTCVPTCMLARCGDGYLYPAAEECDDGNSRNGDRCTKNCRLNLVCEADTRAEQRVSAGDALRVLRKAVGISTRCPLRRCDADGDGHVTTVDALRTLRTAVSPNPADICPVSRSMLLRLQSSVRLEALQFRLDYNHAPGDLVAANGVPTCTALLPSTLTAMHGDPGNGYLNVGIISLQEFQGPLDLVRCEYRGSAEPSADDFEIIVVDATSTNGDDFLLQTVVDVILE